MCVFGSFLCFLRFFFIWSDWLQQFLYEVTAGQFESIIFCAVIVTVIVAKWIYSNLYVSFVPLCVRSFLPAFYVSWYEWILWTCCSGSEWRVKFRIGKWNESFNSSLVFHLWKEFSSEVWHFWWWNGRKCLCLHLVFRKNFGLYMSITYSEWDGYWSF